MIELDQQNPSATRWTHRQYESLFANFDPQLSERFVLVAEDSAERPTKAASGISRKVLAFLVARRIDKEWELENIVVAENCRRCGLAIQLLGALIDHVRANRSRSIFLEVRQSNGAARALYRKIGFVETGSRKSYYSNPPEAAILYQLSLSHNEIAP